MRDALDHLTVNDLDVWGRTVEVHPPTAPWTRYTYDAADRMTRVEQLNGSGVVQATTTLTYDAGGRKIQMNDPDMGSWNYTYDALGNLLTQADARCISGSCVTTSMTYDALNRLTQKTYTIPSGLNVGPTNTVHYYYDEGGADGNTIGKRTRMTDGSGVTNWTYDTRGRMKTESKTITGSGTFLTQWGYNAADQVSWMKYPGGSGGQPGEQVNYTYNAQMALDTVTGTDSYVRSTDYDAAGRVVLSKMGWTGSTYVLQTGYTYYSWYTQGGRLWTMMSGTPTDLDSLQYFEYHYDAIGDVNWIKDYNAGGTQTQTFHYDQLNRLIDAVASGGSGGTYPLENYNYDVNTGNLSSKAGVNYTYNSGKPHAVSSLSNGWSFSYDSNGNMTRKLSSGGDFRLTYDAENHLISAFNDAIFADGFETGNLSKWSASQTDGGDLSVTTNAKIGGTYGLQAVIDDSNSIYVQDASPEAQTSYNARFYFGLMGVIWAGEDTVTIFQAMDASGKAGIVIELNSYTDGGGSSSVQRQESGELNGALVVPTPGPVLKFQVRAGAQKDNGTWSYTNWYPIEAAFTYALEVDWKAAESGSNHNGQISLYMGDVLKQSITGLDNDTYKVDDVRMGAVSGVDSGTRGTYRFDSFVSNRYNHIGLGHLIPVGSNVSGEYLYDGDGNRVQSTVDGVTTAYVGNYYEWSGSTATKYYYVGGQRVAMRKGGTLYYLLGDHLGSTSVTTYSGGVKMAEVRYKPFGEDRYTSGTTPTDFRFTGQRIDSYINIYWYNSRWYDPALSWWIQPNSIVPDPNNPQSWNRYNYVGNNPCNFNDPDGHCWPVCTLLAGGFVGAVAGVGLYTLNTIRSGQSWNAGEAALAGGVGAIAGAMIATVPGAVAAANLSVAAGTAFMSAGIGMASSGAGYMAVNAVTGNEFNSTDFAIAAGVGTATGALGPSVATSYSGAIALNSASSLIQYEATSYAHTGSLSLDEGALMATSLGGIAGAVGGPFPKPSSMHGNLFPKFKGAMKGWSSELGSTLPKSLAAANAYAARNLAKLTFRQNLWRGLAAGLASNLPIPD